MCDGTSSSIKDSARLRGLKQVLSRGFIDEIIGEQLKTRYCMRITNQQLIWLIVGMGLFAGKSYRQIFRLCASPTTVVVAEIVSPAGEFCFGNATTESPGRKQAQRNRIPNR